MIQAIKYINIIKNLRSTIMAITKLPGKKVLNSDSVRGTDLSEVINDIDVMSFNMADIFILFELLEDNRDQNIIIPENNNTTSSFATYKFVLHIYGNLSYECAQMIMTRLRDPGIATELRENGIFLSGVNYPDNTKEFINNTLWQRCDLDILIEVRYNFENISKEEYFNEVENDIKVINI